MNGDSTKRKDATKPLISLVQTSPAWNMVDIWLTSGDRYSLEWSMVRWGCWSCNGVSEDTWTNHVSWSLPCSTIYLPQRHLVILTFIKKIRKKKEDKKHLFFLEQFFFQGPESFVIVNVVTFEIHIENQYECGGCCGRQNRELRLYFQLEECGSKNYIYWADFSSYLLHNTVYNEHYCH